MKEYRANKKKENDKSEDVDEDNLSTTSSNKIIINCYQVIIKLLVHVEFVIISHVKQDI
jgi:hypothetical protein